MNAHDIRRHTVDIAPGQVDDLRTRLANTRFPERETVDDVSQGVPLARLRALCSHWQTSYDFQRVARLLDGIGQFMTSIEGVDIHCLHAKSADPRALPLLMCHGWPGSVLEFQKVIGPLTEPAAHGRPGAQAFHVIAPAMPGFGFSGKPVGTGWGLPRIADAWIELMRRLGHGSRWGMQGGDLGAGVCDAIARKKPGGLVGMHLNFAMFMTTPEEAAMASPEEKDMLRSAGHFWDQLSGYAKVQSTRPQTIGYALADSPAGLAAWILAMLQDTCGTPGDAEASFSKDDILDAVMMYWLTNTAASSARLYWEIARAGGPAGGQPTAPIGLPSGFTMLPMEQVRKSRRWTERRYANVVYFHEGSAGGHFAAWEQPLVLSEDIRRTFERLM